MIRKTASEIRQEKEMEKLKFFLAPEMSDRKKQDFRFKENQKKEKKKEEKCIKKKEQKAKKRLREEKKIEERRNKRRKESLFYKEYNKEKVS